MNAHFVYLTSTFLVSLLCTSAVYAVNDPNAPVMQLRHPDSGGCIEAGNVIDNCVVATNSIKIHKLSTANSLIVEVGPGSYGQFFCNGITDRNISVRGAGIDTTTIASLTLLGGCPDITFSDLTIGGTGINYAVAVIEPGTTTTWINVKMAGPWQEYCEGVSTVPAGRHTWHGSQIIADHGYYEVECDDSWFFGSEITSQGDLSQGIVNPFRVMGAELHVYGSVIRALGTGTGAASTLLPLTAVTAIGGNTHIHGTGIDVISVDGAPASVTALSASNGAIIHASEAAFNLSTGVGGTVTRIDNQGGTVRSPYLWENLPASGKDFSSETGADMTTITNTSDGQPHLVIYSNLCTSKWYDIVDKVCLP